MKQKLTLMFLFTLLLFSCWKNNNLENTTPSNTSKKEIETYDHIWFLDEEKLKNFLADIPNEKVKTLIQSLDENDFVTTQNIIPTIIEELKVQNEESIEVFSTLHYTYVSAILNEWNYTYNEAKKSNQAIDYLNKLVLHNPDFVDPVYNNYYLWYAHEITRKYEEALKYYNEALRYAPDIPKNKIIRSLLLNQIGHVYHLKWDIDTAYNFYLQAYNIDNTNQNAIINIARVLVRKNDLENAKKYFETALQQVTDKFILSELHYNLSSLYFFSQLQDFEKMEKSSEYAKKSIEYNQKSPLWYLWVARVYITQWKNLDEAEKLLKKSIKIYPNFSPAYEWLWILEQWKGMYSKSIEYFLKWIEVIPNDIILMWNERNSNLARLHYLLSVSLALWKNQEYSLKHLHEMLSLQDVYSVMLFTNEIKKENYWVFKNLEWNQEFEMMISFFK